MHTHTQNSFISPRKKWFTGEERVLSLKRLTKTVIFLLWDNGLKPAADKRLP